VECGRGGDLIYLPSLPAAAAAAAALEEHARAQQFRFEGFFFFICGLPSAACREERMRVMVFALAGEPVGRRAAPFVFGAFIHDTSTSTSVDAFLKLRASPLALALRNLPDQLESCKTTKTLSK